MSKKKHKEDEDSEDFDPKLVFTQENHDKLLKKIKAKKPKTQKEKRELFKQLIIMAMGRNYDFDKPRTQEKYTSKLDEFIDDILKEPSSLDTMPQPYLYLILKILEELEEKPETTKIDTKQPLDQQIISYIDNAKTILDDNPEILEKLPKLYREIIG